MSEAGWGVLLAERSQDRLQEVKQTGVVAAKEQAAEEEAQERNSY